MAHRGAHKTTIKDFSIARLLGKGSYGSVYKAIRNNDGLEYAIKKVDLATYSARERTDASTCRTNERRGQCKTPAGSSSAPRY